MPRTSRRPSHADRDDHRKPLTSYSAMDSALARGLHPPSYTTTRDLTPDFSHDPARTSLFRRQYRRNSMAPLLWWNDINVWSFRSTVRSNFGGSLSGSSLVDFASAFDRDCLRGFWTRCSARWAGWAKSIF
jgi:hypothetical protein